MGAGGLAMMAGGGLLGAAGQMQQGAAAKGAADFNAYQMESNAREAEKKAAEDARQFRVMFRKQEATNKVAVAASGIRLEGSAMEVLRENARNAAKDEIAIKMQGRRQADTLRQQARFTRMQGKYALRGAQLGAAATLLDTGGKIGTQMG